MHGLRNDENALVGGLAERCVDVGNLQFLVFNESVHTLTNHAHTFLNGFLKGASDGHNLTYRLHRRSEFLVNAMELAQIPAWNLADHIVECRLKECGCCLGDGVLQFKQSVSHSKFCSHEGQGITCGF